MATILIKTMIYVVIKCLKIPKGLSEGVNRRRTDNTMTKKTKQTLNDSRQSTTQKTKN